MSPSNFDQVGAALADPGPSQTGSQDAPPESPTETVESSPEAPVEGETSAEGADATAQPETEPEPEQPLDAATETPEGEPQTLDVFLKTPRGKEIYQGFKQLREYSKPVAEGGIGHTPTVEQIRDYYGAYRDRILMDHDLSSGNPQQATQFANYVFGPQADGQPRPNAHVLAAQLAPTLARVNPEAYAAAANPFLSNYNTALWDRWAEAKTPNLKAALYQAAQMLHYDMTGQYKPVAELGGANGTQQQADPFAAERSALAAERQRIEQYHSEQQTAQARAMENHVAGIITQGFHGELDKALTKLKSLPNKTDSWYERRRREFGESVVRDVPTHNPHAWSIYNTAYQQAIRTNNPALHQAAAQQFANLASPVIAAKAKQFVDEELGVYVKQSETRNSQLRSIDGHRLPSSSGSAVPPAKPNGQPMQRLPGETQADFNLRQMRA